jgi:hypothetical protein
MSGPSPVGSHMASAMAEDDERSKNVTALVADYPPIGE